MDSETRSAGPTGRGRDRGGTQTLAAFGRVALDVVDPARSRFAVGLGQRGESVTDGAHLPTVNVPVCLLCRRERRQRAALPAHLDASSSKYSASSSGLYAFSARPVPSHRRAQPDQWLMIRRIVSGYQHRTSTRTTRIGGGLLVVVSGRRVTTLANGLALRHGVVSLPFCGA